MCYLFVDENVIFICDMYKEDFYKRRNCILEYKFLEYKLDVYFF